MLRAVRGPLFGYRRRSGAVDLPETFDDLALVVGIAADCAEQVRDIGARTGADVVALTPRHQGGPGRDAVVRRIAGLGAVSATAGLGGHA